MRTLVIHKRLFKFLGLLLDTNPSKFVRELNLLHSFSAVIVIYSTYLPVIVYFWVNMDDLRKTTDATYIITSMSISLGMYYFLGTGKKQLRKLFDDLQYVVDQREHLPTIEFYKNADARTILFTRRMFTAFAIILVLAFIIPLTIIVIRYATATEIADDEWFLPYKVVMPFKYNANIFNYLVALVIEAMSGTLCCIILATVCSFFFAICWYITACFSDLSTIFAEINETIIAEKVTDIPDKIHEYLKEIIAFHGQITKFAADFAELMNGVIFIMIAVGVLCLCTVMFQIQRSVETMKLLLFQTVGATFLVLLMMFVFCYFGNIVTIKATEVAYTAYQSLWYKYPLRYQWYIIMIMQRSQKPYYLKGFGMITCSLESFTRMINTAASLYMVFRKVE